MDLGVDEAEVILGSDVSAKQIKQLREYLAAQLDSNDKYIETSLLPAMDEPEAPLEGTALVDRLGAYADQLYQVANKGMAEPLQDSGLIFNWLLDESVTNHCDQCLSYADGSPFGDPESSGDDSLDPLPDMPGGPTLGCFGNCRCTVSIEQGSWEKYAAAQDAADEA